MTIVDEEIAWLRGKAKLYERVGMLKNVKSCRQAIKRLERAKKDKNAVFFDRDDNR